VLHIGLVAHDERKPTLLEWVGRHRAWLGQHELFATGTTGALISEQYPDLRPRCFHSGPLGGDQQLGAAIAEGKLQALIFFIDPLSPHPHDVDVKALLRLAILYDIPFACNAASASLLASSLGKSASDAFSEKV
jgi:methylglyoxal synthase